jgi:DNA primase
LAVNEDEQYWHCFGCGKSGSIYSWIQLTENLSFPQAVQKVAELTNSDINEYVESESLNFFKTLSKLKKTDKEVPSRVPLDMDKDYIQRFKDEVPQEWIDEGISPETMKKYEIRIDPMSNRIVYPVKDNNDNLIGVKGRTRFNNFKELKIMKYMNYHRLGILDFYQGMQQARESINISGEIIIVEGIKSVMKLDQWGFHNTVSAETSKLNEYQIELLIRMKVRDVVIAFDKDVQMKKIRECTELLKRFTNVYVVYDKWGLLEDKDSPCDRGQEVWQTLYDRRMRL